MEPSVEAGLCHSLCDLGQGGYPGPLSLSLLLCKMGRSVTIQASGLIHVFNPQELKRVPVGRDVGAGSRCGASRVLPATAPWDRCRVCGEVPHPEPLPSEPPQGDDYTGAPSLLSVRVEL